MIGYNENILVIFVRIEFDVNDNCNLEIKVCKLSHIWDYGIKNKVLKLKWGMRTDKYNYQKWYQRLKLQMVDSKYQ